MSSSLPLILRYAARSFDIHGNAANRTGDGNGKRNVLRGRLSTEQTRNSARELECECERHDQLGYVVSHACVCH